MNYTRKYKFYASLNGGGYWYELRLKKQIDLTYKKEKGQAFYRVESGDWDFMKYQNLEFFNLLALKIEHPDTITNELLVRISYAENFTTFTKFIYTGYVPLNGFMMNIDEGQCKMKPKKKDEYTWYDEKNDILVNVESVAKNDVIDIYNATFGESFMKASDLMNHLLSFHETGLTFESDFLSNPISPITGLENGYANLLFQADCYFLPDLPDGWVPEIAIKDLIELFIKAFNCEWYIDGGKLKVEHINYFNNGLSYTGTPTVGIDLTNVGLYKRKYQVLADITGRSTSNRFSYSVEGFPSKVSYKYGWSSRTIALTYQHPLASKDVTEAITVTKFEADTEYPQFDKENIDENNFFIASCDTQYFLTPGHYKMLKASVRTIPPPIPFSINMPNGHLFFDVILRVLFSDNSYFSTGKINGYDHVFTSRKRIKQQEDLTFPHLEDFEPSALIKTNFGDGEVSALKLNTDTGFIKTTLLFDCETSGSGGVPAPIPEE